LRLYKKLLQFYGKCRIIKIAGAIRQEKGITENGDKKPGGYVHHLSTGRRWSRMEIAYIVCTALVAIVAILAHRNMKK